MKRIEASYSKRNMLVLTAILLVYVVFYLIGVGCPIRFLTGVPCPGCGMTRAGLALLHGRVREALHFHPAIFLVPFLPVWVLFHNRWSRRLQKILALSIVTILILFYIYRLTHPDDVISIRLSDGVYVKIYHFLLGR